MEIVGGTQMEFIGKEFVRHEFRFTPAKGKVVNIYRETYKCPECAISEEHPDDQTFVKAIALRLIQYLNPGFICHQIFTHP